MKKFLFAVVLLTGCNSAPQEQATAPIKNAIPKPEVRTVSFHTSDILVDPETGCQYLTLYSHGITPRMARNAGGYHHQVGCELKGD